MYKVKFVIKRTGAIVPFNPDRITNAIYRAAVAVGGRDKDKATELSEKVIKILETNHKENYKPHISKDIR